jgi:hypothetical protein
MIGKIIVGKSFRGCLSYLFEGRLQESKEMQDLELAKKQAEVIAFNQCFGNKKELIKQFNEVRNLNTKQSRPVFHATLSFAHNDAGKLDKQQKTDIATELAKSFKFEDNQYVVISHADTKHEHLHIVANRIGFDGKTANDSNSYKRMANFCRQIEQAYQLMPVLSPNKFLKPEHRVPQSRRIDQRKELLKQHLRSAIQKCSNIRQLKQYMEQQGYSVELGRGIAFTDRQQVRFKGSQVGYALLDIGKKLQLRQKQLLETERMEKQRKSEKHERGLSL